MSEENTTQETSQSTEEQVTEETSQNTIDLDTTIKVDGEEVSVKDLIQAREEISQLREYNDKARMLISPVQGGTSEDRESAVRYLMNAEGYDSAEIEGYLEMTRAEAEPQYEQPQYEQPQYNYQPQETEQNPQDVYYQQEQLRMQEQDQARLRDIEERQSRINSEMMRKEMDETLKQAFSSSDEIKKLIGLSENDNRKDVLMKEVESAMMQQLRDRRAKGENFNKNWFAEEAGKATKFVYDKFSSVIGDPDKIQRSPETATEDSLFNKPPVDPPKYEKGDDMGSINTKTRDWTLDTLLRGAREGAAGGESKA